MGGKKFNYIGLTIWCEPQKIVDMNLGDYVLIGGEEKCPETGKLHHHGLIYTKEPQCWLNIFKPLAGQVHLVYPIANPAEYCDYCVKEESKTGDKLFYEKGLKPSKTIKKEQKERPTNQEVLDKGLISLVRENRVSILQYERNKRSVDKFLLDTTPLVNTDGPKGIWVYGDPGCGKSYAVRKKYPDLYLKPQNKWWDGYSGQKVILLDDFDCVALSHYLKIWADAYGFNGEVKAGTIPINYDKFIITSNYTIDEMFVKGTPVHGAISRRFKFIHKLNRETDILNLI